MRKIFTYLPVRALVALVMFVAALAGNSDAGAQSPPRAPVWEVVNVHEASVQTPADGDGLEVSVHQGVVYISAERPVTVKVFSILGQLITQRQMQPGTVRLTLGTRGIYILKTEGTTRRINL